MRCPFCAHLEDRVVDSRTGKNGEIIRRRRECLKCQRRFTTYERVEEVLPTVVKKDGRREPFDRRKIVEGVKIACQKRPVSAEAIEELVSGVERAVMEQGEREVRSTTARYNFVYRADHGWVYAARSLDIRQQSLRDLVLDIDRPGFLSKADFEALLDRPDWFLWNLLTFDIFQKRVLNQRN